MMIMFLGVLPSLLLLTYIYRQDRIEKEPGGLLLKLFASGALATLPASAAEGVGQSILRIFFPSEQGEIFLLLTYFLVVAVTEEAVKLAVLRKIAWHHPAFNFRFDAVVYAVAVSLGFAALENIFYIWGFGLQVVRIRAVTAIPMHCITGIFMGHYVGQSKFMENSYRWEKMKHYDLLAFVVPVLLHGYYDYCASTDNSFLGASFFIYVVILDVVAFLSLRRYSHTDQRIGNEEEDIFQEYR